MKSQARSITTNQHGVHEDLLHTVQKHQKHASMRPIAEHTTQAFNDIIAWLSDWKADVIIDACCGVGESTINLAQQFPDARIVGIDKSISRLEKHNSYITASSENHNYKLVQADLNDFWRLLSDHLNSQDAEQRMQAWKVTKQYILYPNPYPKKSQLNKRWHGSSVFPSLVKVCSNIEVRSNWNIYLEEFLHAANEYGLAGDIMHITGSPMTPFERKYIDSGQTCLKLVIRPSGCDK